MTNREWLNNLTDEQLAEVIAKDNCCEFCCLSMDCHSSAIINGLCVKGIVKFFKSEYRE